MSKNIAQLICIETELGEYNTKFDSWTIGSLVLKDSLGRLVNVKDGLSLEQKLYHEDCYIDQIIEIKFDEIIANGNYIKPIFIRVVDSKYKTSTTL